MAVLARQYGIPDIAPVRLEQTVKVLLYSIKTAGRLPRLLYELRDTR